jgi:hypothetical protein
MEVAANRWALDRAFDIRINPSPAHPMLLFYSITGITDHEQELRSTHPADIHRYADFLDRIAGWYVAPKTYEKKFGEPPTADMISDDDRVRANARTSVPK